MTEAKLKIAVDPVRFAWANANRVADDHELEVEVIAAEASRAVAAKLAGSVPKKESQ